MVDDQGPEVLQALEGMENPVEELGDEARLLLVLGRRAHRAGQVETERAGVVLHAGGCSGREDVLARGSGNIGRTGRGRCGFGAAATATAARRRQLEDPV